VRERLFLTEVLAGAKAAGAWVYKIPDTGPVNKGETRFFPKRPFDAIIALDNLTIAIEAKVVRRGGRLELRPHQHDELLGFGQRKGHQGYVVVRVEGAKWKDRGGKIDRWPISVPTRVFAVPIKWYANWLLRQRQHGNEIKGIPWGLISEYGLEMARLPNVGWSIEAMLPEEQVRRAVEAQS